jgi:CheY-like chemotaxis protein
MKANGNLMAPRVVFVDDDPMLLASTCRGLRDMLMNMDVRYFDSGRSALGYLEENAVDIVFSDIRMPGMDGEELLNRIAAKFPDTIRFAITAQAEPDQLKRVFATAHQVFAKPCAVEQLQETIHDAITLRSRIPAGDLRKWITGWKLNSVGGTQLSSDRQQLTVARIIGLANSSYFGHNQSIDSWPDAIDVLGSEIRYALFRHTPQRTSSYKSAQENFSESNHQNSANSHDLLNGSWCSKNWSDNLEGRQSNFYEASAKVGQCLINVFREDSVSVQHSSHHPSSNEVGNSSEPNAPCYSIHDLGAYAMYLWGFPRSVFNALADNPPRGASHALRPHSSGWSTPVRSHF